MASDHAADLTTVRAGHDTAATGVRSVCEQVFRLLADTVRVEGGSIHVLEDSVLRPLATFPRGDDGDLSIRVPLGDGLIGRVLASGDPHYVPDVRMNGGVSDGINSYFVVPLVNGERPIGVLQVDATEVDALSPEDQRAIVKMAPLIAAAVEGAICLEERTAENVELHDEVQSRKSVLSAVAHELRTPLAAVLGFAETLSLRAAAMNPEMIATAGNHLVKASRRLDRLIGDLLDVSRLERGSFSVYPASVDIHAIIDQALFEVDISEHGLEVDVASTLPPVWADAERLQQVLVNLLTNARKYSYPGTTISLNVDVVGDHLRIAVADQGVGIPLEELAPVFEPFHRIETLDRPNVTGLGLGLYLAREICLAMDCDIHVESKPGMGSSFVIEVPLDRR
jgi:two-component system, OmpR family, sensor histidine kinase KdpD